MRLLLSLAIDLLHFLDQCDYHACCDFYLVPFRGDIATKLKAAMDTTPSVADFEHCIVGMAETSKPADCGIALALLRTLQHSRHFHSVVVRGFPIGDDGISMAFQTLEQPHPVLSSIRLSNVLASRGGLQALESAAKTKHQSPSEWTLTSLDLSDNSKWAKESVVALVSALKAFPSPLRVLNLAHCHLTHLMPLVAVLAQPSWAATLRTLDLSFNPMDADATAGLTGWLSQVKVLQHLNLAGTGIDTFQVINALKRNAPLYKSALMALDLSYNTLKPTTAAALGEMLETTQSFTSLVLRNVKPALASPTLSTILSPWFQNPHFATPSRASDLALSLDLSENNLSGGGGTLLADLISRSPRLRRDVLKLNQCTLHDDSLDAIVVAVAQCDSLSALHLEDNDGSPPPKSIFFSSPAVLRHAPGDAFVKVLTKQVQLKELYLSNSHPQSRYPLALLRAVVHSLGTTNSTLEVLDISGNGGGDDVAKCVAAVLPKTSCLRALFWDGNHTTLAGFRLVQEALRRNQSLRIMPVPVQDTRRLLDRRDPQREALFAVLGSMCESIERNQATVETHEGPTGVMSSMVFRDDAYDKADVMRRSWLQSGPADLRQSWSRGLDALSAVPPSSDNNYTSHSVDA
ncbi:hypothetical protein, variant [Aphanomyces astaci]|uniref:Uncharacterized protein n=1 Tax=Aphanomyces astaci TaxID=112090 RepID=W4G7A4_APHAT|nr:hypothetical protein, variant [Aphanomyces astaci]ETV75567.1 hypothetical protein, variant [Aphanomyces astaci]|eukprot:XP_009834698.1 hypothetical protein, variant [Aphanomyces astaci]